ncbi:hypothetical protein GUJ93_ZPchr0002g23852 [Zizania palustris]|uniref:Uncharacterized protein n=1 Tax=Zizania palustris TaxID=103762 RepID=A0A8J5S4H6_ZIZPA|nr:hypothetical protein GUJ93_ZPchr0002g23852 [Zizania palustris]
MIVDRNTVPDPLALAHHARLPACVHAVNTAVRVTESGWLEPELPGAAGGGVSVGIGSEVVALHAAGHVSCSSSSHPEGTASSASLTAARASLPDTPVLYPFQELAAATNNFLARRAPATAYWRCTLRGCDAALFPTHCGPRLSPPPPGTAGVEFKVLSF